MCRKPQGHCCREETLQSGFAKPKTKRREGRIFDALSQGTPETAGRTAAESPARHPRPLRPHDGHLNCKQIELNSRARPVDTFVLTLLFYSNQVYLSLCSAHEQNRDLTAPTQATLQCCYELSARGLLLILKIPHEEGKDTKLGQFKHSLEYQTVSRPRRSEPALRNQRCKVSILHTASRPTPLQSPSMGNARIGIVATSRINAGWRLNPSWAPLPLGSHLPIKRLCISFDAYAEYCRPVTPWQCPVMLHGTRWPMWPAPAMTSRLVIAPSRSQTTISSMITSAPCLHASGKPAAKSAPTVAAPVTEPQLPKAAIASSS